MVVLRIAGGAAECFNKAIATLIGNCICHNLQVLRTAPGEI